MNKEFLGVVSFYLLGFHIRDLGRLVLIHNREEVIRILIMKRNGFDLAIHSLGGSTTAKNLNFRFGYMLSTNRM